MIPPWLPAPECPYSPATFAWYRFRRVVVCCCGRSGRRIEWIREVAPALTDSVCIPPFLLCYKTRAVFAAAASVDDGVLLSKGPDLPRECFVPLFRLVHRACPCGCESHVHSVLRDAAAQMPEPEPEPAGVRRGAGGGGEGARLL